MRMLAGLAGAAIVAAGAWAILALGPTSSPNPRTVGAVEETPAPAGPRQTHYRVSASYAQYTLQDLRTQAEAVVLFTATGVFRTHWNDAANLPWALGEVGKKSHIYRDETIVVTKVLSGSIAASSIIVRALGGTVGDMSIEYEEDVRLQAGKSYIGFLRREDTPTQEGSERFWTFVWQGNGVFTQTGTGWQNYAGMTASAADLVQ